MSPDEQSDPPREGEVARIMQDVEERTLAPMRSRFSQIIYLASLRDYNTGRYHHHGLENRFDPESVDEALHRLHLRIFNELNALPLEQQTHDLIEFFESLAEDRARLITTWQQLRSYQVLSPQGCHPLVSQLFEKNMEVLLTVLRETDLWALLHEPHRDADDLP